MLQSSTILNLTLLTRHRVTQTMYVDDIVASGDTEEEGFRIDVKSNELLSHGSFNLRKFLSNGRSMKEKIH